MKFSIILFVLSDTNVLGGIVLHGHPLDANISHFVHMAIFIVSVLYVVSIILLIILMNRTAMQWSRYEEMFEESSGNTLGTSPTNAESSSKRFSLEFIGRHIPGHRFSLERGRDNRANSEVESPSVQQIVKDIDSKLNEYNVWYNSASFLEKIVKFRKLLSGRELLRAVEFRHVRSFFVR